MSRKQVTSVVWKHTLSTSSSVAMKRVFKRLFKASFLGENKLNASTALCEMENPTSSDNTDRFIMLG
jgi:hypothetical protein